MEQRSIHQPKRHSIAIRRNEALHIQLYKKIAALVAVKQVSPAIRPNTRTEFIYPQASEIDKARQPIAPAVKIIEAPDGFITSAENVYRTRKHILFTVTLMNGRAGRVVDLKAAKGELLRHPNRLIAVVYNEDTGHREDVEIKAFQPLKVVV